RKQCDASQRSCTSRTTSQDHTAANVGGLNGSHVTSRHSVEALARAQDCGPGSAADRGGLDLRGSEVAGRGPPWFSPNLYVGTNWTSWNRGLSANDGTVTQTFQPRGSSTVVRRRAGRADRWLYHSTSDHTECSSWWLDAYDHG